MPIIGTLMIITHIINQKDYILYHHLFCKNYLVLFCSVYLCLKALSAYKVTVSSYEDFRNVNAYYKAKAGVVLAWFLEWSLMFASQCNSGCDYPMFSLSSVLFIAWIPFEVYFTYLIYSYSKVGNSSKVQPEAKHTNSNHKKTVHSKSESFTTKVAKADI